MSPGCLFQPFSTTPMAQETWLCRKGKSIFRGACLVAGISMELPTDRAAPSGTPDRQTPPSPHCGESHQMLPALDERSWLRPRRADETQSLGTAGAQSCQAQCVCVGGGIAEPGLGDMLEAQGWQGLIRQAWTPKRAATCLIFFRVLISTQLQNNFI